MATFYGPTSPNGANEGDVWVNQTTGGTWQARPVAATSGAAPTVVAGAGAGSSPGTPAMTAGSNDVRGGVSILTGSSAGTGALVVVTFAARKAAAPRVVLVPTNANAGTASAYVTPTATGFTISIGATGDGVTLTFDYLVTL